MKAKKWNPWPVAIIVLCAAAVLSATYVVVVMVQQRVELVAPDYYAKDLRHQERIDQELRAKSLEKPVTIFYDSTTKAITVAFPSLHPEGTITLYRPSDLSLDSNIAIAVDADGRQEIPAANLASGLWRVRAEWTQDGASYYAEEALRLP